MLLSKRQTNTQNKISKHTKSNVNCIFPKMQVAEILNENEFYR